MWNVARKMRDRPKLGRLGVTGTFAVVALILIFVAGWLVDRRGASAADRRLAELASSIKDQPVDVVTRGARASRILFLSDIHNSVATKQLAAKAVQKIANTSGLDAIIVEIGADQQPYLDEYFDRPQEDASVLMTHARSLGEPGAATRAMMDFYHTVWKLNEKLGADQRIRVIAADLPGWPDEHASPAEAARLMGKRDEQMHNVISNQVLATMPEARVMIFMTGFHGLRTGTLDVQTGGASPVTITPLVERIAQTTGEVYSILVDAPSSGIETRELAPYLGTKVAKILDDAGVKKTFGATIATEFDHVKTPLLEKKSPGIEFGVQPREYKLRDVADAYINLYR